MNALAKRLVVILVSACAAACVADRIHKEGLAAFEHGDYETGVAKLQEAVKADPGNLSYRLDLRAREEAAIQQLISKADADRAAGNGEAAIAGYQRVLSFDPVNDRAKRGLEGVEADRRHVARVGKAAQLLASKQLDAAEAEVRAVIAEDPGFKPATELAGKIEAARGSTPVVPKLRTQDNRAVSLQFRDAPTKMVFEVLARQTGVNFIFDKDVKSDTKTTIFVTNVPVEQAIDLILTQNQLSRQVLSENMVLVYPNTSAKQKDYQDEIIHTFYLVNATPKDAESMLKSVLGTKTLFVDERSSAVVMRDTPEHVRMAEKLVASLDVPEPEVMIELEVLEIDRTLLDQLGINYPTNVSFGASSPRGGTSLVWNDLRHQSSNTISVSPLTVSIDALKTIGHSNVLASPRIRAKNKEKAKVLIGNRLPVITSGVSATVGGSYSTSNVQYIEVGLTLDVTPTVHLDGDVAIKLGLEVSSIIDTITVPIGNGAQTRAYDIGTRNANTVLQLKDGETQVLAGLIQDSDRRTSSHIPGLGDIPVLGRLFGSDGTNAERDEIVLTMTPRIIRAQPRPASDVTEFWYGTESGTRSAPYAAAAPAGGATASSGPAVPGGVSYNTGGPSTTYAPSSGPRAAPTQLNAAAGAPAAVVADAKAADQEQRGEGGGSAAAGGASAPAAAAPAPGKPTITIDGPDVAKVGDEVSVAVKLSSVEALGRLRAQVRFDAGALQLISAEPGDFASSSEQPKIDLKPGGVQLDVGGTAEAPVTGAGDVLNMRFKAVAARAVAITTQVVLIGADGTAVAATPATPLKITVTQ